MVFSVFPLVIGGLFTVIGGVFLFRRTGVAKFFAQAQIWTFGRFGERAAKWTTDAEVAKMGVFFIIFGLLMVALSIGSLFGAFGPRP